uniref:Guanylate cyclase n=1 Tax=Macrostomum lignano TaxID=282301 RepID=A0A1I8GUL4_9PLAT
MVAGIRPMVAGRSRPMVAGTHYSVQETLRLTHQTAGTGRRNRRSDWTSWKCFHFITIHGILRWWCLLNTMAATRWTFWTQAVHCRHGSAAFMDSRFWQLFFCVVLRYFHFCTNFRYLASLATGFVLNDQATMCAVDQALMCAVDQALVDAVDQALMCAVDQALMCSVDQALMCVVDQALMCAVDQALMCAVDQALVCVVDQVLMCAVDQALRHPFRWECVNFLDAYATTCSCPSGPSCDNTPPTPSSEESQSKMKGPADGLRSLQFHISGSLTSNSIMNLIRARHLALIVYGLVLVQLPQTDASIEIPTCDFSKLSRQLPSFVSPRVRYYFNSSTDELSNQLAVGSDPADPFPAQLVAVLLRHVFRYANVSIAESNWCRAWPYRCPVRLDLPHSAGYPFANLGYVYRNAQRYCYAQQSSAGNASSALASVSNSCTPMPSLTELARLPPASYMHVAPSNSTKLRLILHSRRRRAKAINACDWLASQLADSPVRLGALPSQLRIGLIWPRGILFDDPRVLEFANLSVSIINAYNCSRLDPGRPQFCSLLDDNYQLELLPRGLDCSNPGVLDYYMRLHCLDVNCNFEAESAGPIVGMIAGTCSKTVEAVAQASTHLGTMVVAPTVESPVFARRDIYPNFYRTIPSYVAYADTVSQFLVANNWNQLGLLTNKKLFLNSQHFQQDKVRICHDEFLSERELTLQQAKDSLLRAKNEGCQLFAMDYFRKGTCLYMCAAYQLGMFPKNNYQFILAHWAKHIFTERGANCTGTGIHVPEGCTDSQVTEASNGHLVVKGFLPADRLNAYRLRLGEPAEVPMPSRASSPSVGANFDENYFGPYTSDAVYLLANALGQLHSSDSAALHRLKSPLVVAAYRQILAATQFDGFRFGHSHEPGGGFLAVWLRSLQRDGGGGYVSKNLASYRWSINGSAVVVSAESPPALPPSDYLTADGRFIRLLHPACFAAFMRALNPKWSCNQALTAFLAILLTVVLTATAGLFYGVLRYWQQKVQDRANQPFREMRERLAHMEVPKLSICINRKVGEGCFGTVFGGEINISEKRWESCAVKVLTENCKSDAVLKFLEEAEVLCKLDHENIIKLLGVSTVNQPYYIVMEFCLHGDLKSFLMARRTHRDVVYTSPEYLTRYAIDIASGLEYLHSQDPPVLHRDVALRNCLVDSFYRVKLGDFGLARMTPNYYRMQAPNFVPVRWMPPEAIQYAYFSVKSDIWAFAVLLYEMITFGKFPFYDWSHQRVMAEVARGISGCQRRRLWLPGAPFVAKENTGGCQWRCLVVKLNTGGCQGKHQWLPRKTSVVVKENIGGCQGKHRWLSRKTSVVVKENTVVVKENPGGELPPTRAGDPVLALRTEDRPLVSELLHELRDQPPCVAACLDDAPPTQPVLGRDRATVAAMMSGGPGTSGAGGGTCGSLGGGGGGDTWAAVRSLSNVKLNAISLTSVPQWLRSSVQRHRARRICERFASTSSDSSSSSRKRPTASQWPATLWLTA